MRTMFYGSKAITFKNAKRLREKMTEAEKILWSRLSNKQINGYRFKRQHPIAKFIADFYCHQANLIIEVDGGIHQQKNQIIYDKERTLVLEALGCRILRFTNNEVANQIEEVIKTIKNETHPLNPLKGTCLPF